MKGNRKISRILAVCLAAVLSLSLLAGIVPAAEAIGASVLSASTETINTGVRIYLKGVDANGKEVTSRIIPTDVNGNEVEPFIWEDLNGGGTTYLPIRAIADLFGVTINWDADLKCVVIQTPDKLAVSGKAGVDKAAAYASKQVKATKGIKIIANNYEFTPKDANDAAVSVFLLEDANGGGTTYLPIRAMVKLLIGETANVADYITWNGTDRTVTISVPGATLSGDTTEDLDSDKKDENSGKDDADKDDTALDRNYPTVFLHGLMGWGFEDGISNVLNYWGMTAGNMMTYLRGKGYDVYDGSVGPVSSAWDRCCELYAQIAGTEVDYGPAHCAAENAEFKAEGINLTHKQKGRTYDGNPLIKQQWDEKHPINLIGHSFGGPTGRYFINILTNGAPEEIAYAKEECKRQENGNDANWKEYCNDFFEGGHGDYVHSFTSLAGVLNGTTFISTCQFSTEFLSQLCLDLGNAMGVTLLGNIMDFQLEQFGLTRKPGTNDKAYLDLIGDSEFLKGHDNAFFDLSTGGCNILNQKIDSNGGDNKKVYYFSYAGNQTRKTLTGKYLPKVTMTPLFTIFSTKMGCYTNRNEPVWAGNGNYKVIDEKWYPNDGMVNTYTARFPFSAEAEAQGLKSTSDYQPGIWYWTDIDMDHLDFCGQLGLSKPITTRNFYLELMSNIEKTYK